MTPYDRCGQVSIGMETVVIRLGFTSQWQSCPPEIKVVNNGIVVAESITVIETTQLNFVLELEPNRLHVLELHRQGHDGVTQQICGFQSFIVDELDISSIIDHGRFYPEYPEPWISEQRAQGAEWPPYHVGWRQWGWNGVWRLEYESPFYTWLLHTI